MILRDEIARTGRRCGSGRRSLRRRLQRRGDDGPSVRGREEPAGQRRFLLLRQRVSWVASAMVGRRRARASGSAGRDRREEEGRASERRAASRNSPCGRLGETVRRVPVVGAVEFRAYRLALRLQARETAPRRSRAGDCAKADEHLARETRHRRPAGAQAHFARRPSARYRAARRSDWRVGHCCGLPSVRTIRTIF